MNYSLIDLLKCQQRLQNDTTHAFLGIHQSQQDNKNDSLIDDTPTFDWKPELFFD